MILGLLTPSSGEITWNGKKIDYSTSPNDWLSSRRKRIISQIKGSGSNGLFSKTYEECQKKKHYKELEYWLSRFKVPEYADKKVEELSKGNQQKIQFIAAIIHKPKLLILDEPFSGLDPVNVEQLKEAVIELKE